MKLSKEQREALKSEAARQSVLKEEKITPDQLLNKYIEKGLEIENKVREIQNK